MNMPRCVWLMNYATSLSISLFKVCEQIKLCVLHPIYSTYRTDFFLIQMTNVNDPFYSDCLFCELCYFMATCVQSLVQYRVMIRLRQTGSAILGRLVGG